MLIAMTSLWTLSVIGAPPGNVFLSLAHLEVPACQDEDEDDSMETTRTRTMETTKTTLVRRVSHGTKVKT